MAALFVIGLLFLGVTVVLIMRAVALPRLRMTAHLRQIERYGVNGVLEAEATGRSVLLGSSLTGFAERVGRYAAARLSLLTPLPPRELVSAGLYTLSPEVFHGYRVLAA